jgi:hypothetical protein
LTWDQKPCWGGINIGSYTFGVWDVEIAFCRTTGGGACSFGNGNGRLASVWIHDNVFHGAVRTGAMGGLRQNKGGPVPNPNPDTGNSIVERNVYVVTDPDFHVLGCNTGPAPVGSPHEQGREPVTFQHNVIVNKTKPGGPNTSPILYVAGEYTAPIKFLHNRLIDFDAAPARGDLATFSNNANRAVPNQPNMVQEGNFVLKRDGTFRPLVVKIEGPAL